MTPARRPRAALTLAALLSLGPVACDQPTGSSSARPRTSTPESSPEVANATPEPSPTPAPAPAPAQRRLIVGEKTTEVRDASQETKTGGAVAVQPRITARDPITLQGNAYVTAIGQTAMLKIKQAVDIYQADTGEYPKTIEEFQDKVLRPNGIALPLLPAYQKYGYDASTHSLVVLEYPDLKNGPPR